MQQTIKRKEKRTISKLLSGNNKKTLKMNEQENRNAIFGAPLCDAAKIGSILWDLKVPDPVAMCFQEISDRGLTTEGIFRLSGSASEVRELEEEINKYDPIRRKAIRCDRYDVHTVSSLVKKYLRDLPDPVIPVSFHEEFEALEMPPKQIHKLSQLIKRLPLFNRHIIHAILKLSAQIQQHVDINKMNPEALATVFAPVCIGFEKSLLEQTKAIHHHNNYLNNSHNMNTTTTSSNSNSTTHNFKLFKSISSSTAAIPTLFTSTSSTTNKKKYNKKQYTDAYNSISNRNMINQHMKRNKHWMSIWTIMIENHERLIADLDELSFYHLKEQYRSLPSPFLTTQNIHLPNDVMMNQFEPVVYSENDTLIPVAPPKKEASGSGSGGFFHASLAKKTSGFLPKSTSSIRRMLTTASTLR
ncbi:Rho GTPase activation protein [Cokeromyces recurvatus]|uniref:Rho GTPase activation protein n=1 Tax=Cokeromyces recurvatus TaxID=90255 RepID=UPI00221E47B9|nr:Rho GTPase activation protein [Cokeromyces recurvatus]KAI7900664.1 Rho GTPase activation protein [Cokeromyces recurvatus]